ncbi:hypothetical protein GCM10009119_10820 [Algoriphagus jejuensis]|uniref:PKD domain-containing protein n=1 Tax=Algoriphagus jejuensis TaxID=419934 RepID=A0ABP3YBN6_9BACT
MGRSTIYLLLFLISFGCRDEDPEPVKVVANFTPENAKIKQGQSVEFEDISEGNPNKRNWTFAGGDPASSTESNPVVTYNAPGNYEVKLTVTGNGQGNSDTKTGIVEVRELVQVVVDFSADRLEIKTGESVNFEDTSEGSPTSWEWKFEGGNPSTSSEKNPVVSYASAGVFYVSLTARNGDTEATETKGAYIKVREPVQVIAEFKAEPSAIFEGQSVNFADLSEGAPTSWEWTFEGGSPSTSSAQNPTVNYEKEGSYAVTLTVHNEDTQQTKAISDFITVKKQEVKVSSDFAVDADGWKIIGDGQGGSNLFASYSPFKGLDDSGYIYAKDYVTGGVWYFLAPDKYSGDKSGFYGGEISFWLIQKSNMNNQFKSKDIILKGNGLEIFYYHDSFPGLDWTSYSVKLDESAAWYIETNKLASKDQIKSVLANITSVMIRGEFQTGADTGGLDQFEFLPKE